MSKKQRVLKKGLSAIGLLIAITIFAILGIFILVSSQSGRALARDTKRISELDNLRTALQLYHMDHDRYPVSTEDNEGWCSIEAEKKKKEEEEGVGKGKKIKEKVCDDFRKELVSYLSKIPGDPLYPKTDKGKFYSYQYRSTSSGEEYKIHTDLETREPYEVFSGGGFVIEYIPLTPSEIRP